MRLILTAVLATGCGDAFLQVAEGNLSLSPNASADGFTAIEVHWEAIGDVQKATEVMPAPFEFPNSYFVGDGCCHSDSKSFRLSAWLSNGTRDNPTTGPMLGAPYASQVVSVGEQHDSMIDLVLVPYVVP